MDLVQRLESLLRVEGLTDVKVDPEVVSKFLEEHKIHGTYAVEMWYDSKEELNSMELKCTAGDLPMDEIHLCPHNNPQSYAEDASVFIYTKRN